MSQSLEKRKQLFEKFSKQLLLLNQNCIINYNFKNVNPYLCPICLDEFNENDLTPSVNNFLTLEDAPPDSLSGSKIALTCKKCNNGCGTEIDTHLTEVVRAIDASY